MPTDDPVALLLHLAALHPGREEAACDAIVAAMSPWPPMVRLAQQQARARPGMNYNGPDLFRLRLVAQRLRDAPEAITPEVAERLCAAIRAVVPDPRTLPR